MMFLHGQRRLPILRFVAVLLAASLLVEVGARRSRARSTGRRPACSVPGCSKCVVGSTTVCAACRAGYKEVEGRCEQCSAGCATCEFAGPGSCDACKAGFASMKPAMPVELNCTFFGADGERIVWLAAGRRGKQVEWKMSAPAGDVAPDMRAVFRTAYGATASIPG